jgi:hypothetical protein
VYVPPVEDGLESFERAADEAIEQSLAALDGQADGIRIERRVVEGPPDEALVEAAQDAELLVVGTRGHGELISLLLGSVSHQAAKHASCPVVIVRSAWVPGSGRLALEVAPYEADSLREWLARHSVPALVSSVGVVTVRTPSDGQLDVKHVLEIVRAWMRDTSVEAISVAHDGVLVEIRCALAAGDAG